MTGASGTRRLVYDGLNVVGEYNNDNLVNDYYVHGAGPDEPLVWYNYQGGSGRQFFHVDERGSVIATSDATGNRLTLDTYDEYGKPGSTNSGAFQYTGQMWLPEAGVYHYKSRAYLPHLGIFGQTDPAGYAAGPNLYAYVRDDPVNQADPLGTDPQEIIITRVIFADSLVSLSSIIGGLDPFSKMLRQAFRNVRQGLAPSHACAAAAQEPGKIATYGLSATVAEGLGVTGGIGRFVNLATGTTGYYTTGGLGVGEEAATTGGGALFSSMRSFTGGSLNVSGAAGGLAGTISINGSGAGGGTSGAIGAGAAVTVSYTSIFGCSMRK